jgi:cold shock CspA family protein
VPGRDIAVKREQRLHESNEHLHWVINEAFEAAERQIEEYSRIRRKEVKAEAPGQNYARVVRLYPEQGYGFIETREQHNIYFHRAVVRDGRFDELDVGSEVLYTLAPEEGTMGPMASNVQVLGGPAHPVR